MRYIWPYILPSNWVVSDNSCLKRRSSYHCSLLSNVTHTHDTRPCHTWTDQEAGSEELSPFLILRSNSHTLHATVSAIDTENSVCAFNPGVLYTAIFFFLQASKSMKFTPTPYLTLRRSFLISANFLCLTSPVTRPHLPASPSHRVRWA